MILNNVKTENAWNGIGFLWGVRLVTIQWFVDEYNIFWEEIGRFMR